MGFRGVSGGVLVGFMWFSGVVFDVFNGVSVGIVGEQGGDDDGVDGARPDAEGFGRNIRDCEGAVVFAEDESGGDGGVASGDDVGVLDPGGDDDDVLD